MAMPREKEFEQYILEGMARALWVHAYMIWATEVEPAPVMGSSWAEMAPDTPSTRRASHQAADALASLIGEANRLRRDPMATLFAKISSRWDANVAYAFGDEIAHLCMGTLDWDDSSFLLPRNRPPGKHPSTTWNPVIPHFTVELDDDGRDLTWEGDLSGPDLGQGQLNPPLRPAKRRAGDDDDDDDDEGSEADLDRLAEAGRVIHPGTTKLTPAIAAKLIAYRKEMQPLLSPEAQARLDARMDFTFRTGVLDTQTERSLENIMETDVENPAPRRNPSGLEVLVIEDDKQLQKAYPRMLRKMYPTAEVFVVDNYVAAVGYLESHPIKLVISDVDIVGQKTGIDVFAWVKANQPHLVDKYVFVTGGNPQVEQLHYRYAEKPATQDEIKDAIRRPAPGARTTTAREAARPTRPPAATVMLAPTPALTADEVGQLVNEVLPSIRAQASPSGGGRTMGRFGMDKVFISAIWRKLAQDPRLRGMTLPQFKRRLVEANRARVLDLARADLVGAMDPSEVQTSEIEDMGSTFHFVIDRHAVGF
jgi:CheY-like chemotaxis protein